MSQEKANQDVADEVNEAIDSRDEVMHSERNDWLACWGVGQVIMRSQIQILATPLPGNNPGHWQLVHKRVPLSSSTKC